MSGMFTEVDRGMGRIKIYDFDDWTISHALFEWMTKRLNVKTILELGSGRGSDYLADHFDMICIEQDKDWCWKYRQIKYCYAPLYNGWYRTSILRSFLPTVTYNAILIDGPKGDWCRGGFLNNIELFNINVPIIIDDTNRPVAAAMAERLMEMRTVRQVMRIKSVKKESTVIL